MWLACLLFLLVKGGVRTMIVPGYFDIDLVAVTVAYLVAWHGDPWAGAFALGMGFLIDVLSAAPLGLFSVIYLILFLGVRLGDALFDLQSFKGQLIVVFLAVFLKKLLFIGLLNLFSLRTAVDGQVLFAFVCSAVFTALAAPAVSFGYDAAARIIEKVHPDLGEPHP